MGHDFHIKTTNVFAKVFFQHINFCPNPISHSLFKLPLPPCSTSTQAFVIREFKKKQVYQASVMSSRRSRNITKEEINDLVLKLQSLLPQHNQRRNQTVWARFFFFFLILCYYHFSYSLFLHTFQGHVDPLQKDSFFFFKKTWMSRTP
jgi:hypothetical protein